MVGAQSVLAHTHVAVGKLPRVSRLTEHHGSAALKAPKTKVVRSLYSHFPDEHLEESTNAMKVSAARPPEDRLGDVGQGYFPVVVLVQHAKLKTLENPNPVVA